MMGRPLVAIGVLTRNHDEFIQEALDSISRQTVDPDLIIVVDNASTDTTPQILQAWSTADRKSPLVVHFNDTNDNASGGLRKLLELADGRADYLCVLHGDDRLRPIYLKHAYDLLGSVTAPTVWSVAHTDFGPVSVDHPSVRSKVKRQIGLRSWTGAVSVDRLLVAFANFGSMPGCILPVQACLASGLIGEPVETCCTEDWILWQRLLRAGVSLRASPKEVVEYRLHGGGSGADARRSEAIGLARGLAVVEARGRADRYLAKAGAGLDAAPDSELYIRGLNVAGLDRPEQDRLGAASRVVVRNLSARLMLLVITVSGRPISAAVRLIKAARSRYRLSRVAPRG